MKVRSTSASEKNPKNTKDPRSPSSQSCSENHPSKFRAIESGIAGRICAVALALNAPTAAAIAGERSFAEQELKCLAHNIYFEARNQPIEGQIAVAYVTLNRLEESRRLTTICEVVYQPGWFSWTKHKRGTDHKIADQAAWETARKLAKMVMAERDADPVQGSTFFHSVRVAPHWASAMVKVDQIGDHIFYARPKAKPTAANAGTDDGENDDDTKPTTTPTWNANALAELALQPGATEPPRRQIKIANPTPLGAPSSVAARPKSKVQFVADKLGEEDDGKQSILAWSGSVLAELTLQPELGSPP